MNSLYKTLSKEERVELLKLLLDDLELDVRYSGAFGAEATANSTQVGTDHKGTVWIHTGIYTDIYTS